MALKHWTWITTDLQATDEEWKRRFARFRQAGIDAVLPEVFDNHQAAYQSAHLPVAGAWLEQILPLAREAGLEVHAWMHTMTCTIADIVARHPQWYAINARGESTAERPPYVDYYKFLCPSQPPVRDFLRQRVAELAAYAELQSVHLDYIRFPDVILAEALQPRYGIVQDREYPQYDYCYCRRCREAFVAGGGADPLCAAAAAGDEDWRQFRCDLITGLVNEVLAPAARQRGRQVTAAVFPNWQHVRQQWWQWDLDGVLPMLYHSFYAEGIEWIGAECRRGLARLPAGRPLYSGLFVPALSPAELAGAVRVSIEAGAAGVSLFSAGAMSAAHWQSFAAVNRELGKVS